MAARVRSFVHAGRTGARALALAAVILGALAAPAAHAGDGASVVRIGTTTRPDSLNPFVGTNRTAQTVWSLVYDQLTGYGDQLEPVAGLAVGWKRSAEGRLWSFRIREGVRWSDGRPVTAADVAYTLERVLANERGTSAGYLSSVEAVSAPSRRRLVIRLKEPDARLPALPIPIVPRHVWRSVRASEDRAFANREPVGSGPFRLVASDEPDELRFVANEDYWGGRPEVDELIVHVYESQEALADALAEGEVDVAEGLAPASVERLGGVEDVATVAASGPTFVSLGMNTGSPDGDGNPALERVAVRQAIARALDRDALRRAALGDQGTVGSTIVPPWSRFHADVPSSDLLSRDPDAAARLLDRAGLRDTDGDGVRETREGEPFRLRLFSRLGVPETTRVGELAARMLGDVGIEVEVAALTDGALDRRIARGRYDLFVWGWTAEPDPDTVLSVLTCAEQPPGGRGDTYYCEQLYDRLYGRQRTALEPRGRLELVRRMQLLAYDASPYVVLYYRPEFQAYRPDRITGLVPQPAPDGPLVFSYGTRSYLEVRPLGAGEEPALPAGAAAGDTQAGGGDDEGALADKLSSNRLWIVIAAGLLVLALLGSILLVLRNRHADGGDDADAHREPEDGFDSAREHAEAMAAEETADIGVEDREVLEDTLARAPHEASPARERDLPPPP